MHFKQLKQSLIEVRPGYQPMTTETVNGDRFLELCRLEREGKVVMGPSIAIVNTSQYKVSYRHIQRRNQILITSSQSETHPCYP
jgi:hypothetical protein